MRHAIFYIMKEAFFMFDRKMLEDLRIQREEWEKSLKKDIDRYGERRKEFSSSSGIPSQSLYTPLDLEKEKIEYLERHRFPWTVSFYSGNLPQYVPQRTFFIPNLFGVWDTRETNKRGKLLLQLGVNDLQLAADLPTQVGYDSDHIMSRGKWAKWAWPLILCGTWRSSSMEFP